MLVAEIVLTEESFSTSVSHPVGFDDLAVAYAEYERIAALIQHREERKNDLSKTLECVGSSNKVTMPLDRLRSVGLVDYAKAEEQRRGLPDAYPNVFRRP